MTIVVEETVVAGRTTDDARENLHNSVQYAWEQVRWDCAFLQTGNARLHDRALWQAINPFLSQWVLAKSRLPKGWEFWRDWYQDALDGHPPDWPLLNKIALIEPEIWDAGPEAVNAQIARIERERESVVLPASPELALSRNAAAVRLQVGALAAFLEQEIVTLRGRNDVTSAESEGIGERVTLLRELVHLTDRMQEALVEGASPANALVVVEESLPALVEGADKLAVGDAETVVSETIVTMAAAIRHLTDNGTPGHLATGIAVFDLASRKMRGWFSRDKNSQK